MPRKVTLFLALGVIILVTGCTSTPTPSSVSKPTTSPISERIASPKKLNSAYNLPTISGPGGTIRQQLARLIPAGATIDTPPGSSGKDYLMAPLASPKSQDVIALYASGPKIQGNAAGCTGPRNGMHRACRVLVAEVTPHQGLKVLWRWNDTGYKLTNLALVNFTGAQEPQLYVTIGVSMYDEIRVVSFAGGKTKVLLNALGSNPTELPPQGASVLPGVAFWLNDVGQSGIWEVWSWDASLSQFVRADGSFPTFYQKLASKLTLPSPPVPWEDFYDAIAYLQAGDLPHAMDAASQGLSLNQDYLAGNPGFYEIEGTVYRRKNECNLAIPLYQKVIRAGVAAGIGWPGVTRAWYGLGLCAAQYGQTATMRVDLERAISIGVKVFPHSISENKNGWYGYAQAEKLLKAGTHP